MRYIWCTKKKKSRHFVHFNTQFIWISQHWFGYLQRIPIWNFYFFFFAIRLEHPENEKKSRLIWIFQPNLERILRQRIAKRNAAATENTCKRKCKTTHMTESQKKSFLQLQNEWWKLQFLISINANLENNSRNSFQRNSWLNCFL